jgi:hypothetical protein
MKAVFEFVIYVVVEGTHLLKRFLLILNVKV